MHSSSHLVLQQRCAACHEPACQQGAAGERRHAGQASQRALREHVIESFDRLALPESAHRAVQRSVQVSSVRLTHTDQPSPPTRRPLLLFTATQRLWR